jgi:hypothetical protein
LIRVYDHTGNVIETHERNGDFKRSLLIVSARDETLSVTAIGATVTTEPRAEPDSRVGATGCVGIERNGPDSRILDAGGVVKERS